MKMLLRSRNTRTLSFGAPGLYDPFVCLPLLEFIAGRRFPSANTTLACRVRERKQTVAARRKKVEFRQHQKCRVQHLTRGSYFVVLIIKPSLVHTESRQANGRYDYTSLGLSYSLPGQFDPRLTLTFCPCSEAYAPSSDFEETSGKNCEKKEDRSLLTTSDTPLSNIELPDIPHKQAEHRPHTTKSSNTRSLAGRETPIGIRHIGSLLPRPLFKVDLNLEDMRVVFGYRVEREALW